MDIKSRSDEYNHLHESMLELVASNDEIRINSILEGMWINYPVATTVLARLEEILADPRVDTRVPNIVIYARTNNGKTTLIKEFLKRHPASESDSCWKRDVLLITAPRNLNDLYNQILIQIGGPKKGTIADKYIQLVRQLPVNGTKILAIDNAQDSLLAKRADPIDFLNGLKNLGEEPLRLSIVLLGIHSLLSCLTSDDQIANRFKEVFLLPDWEYGVEFRKFLAGFERFLPLKLPSNLQNPPFARILHELTEGSMGELSGLLKKAAIKAIVNKQEKIDERLVKDLEWVSPSKAKIKAQKTLDSDYKEAKK